MNFSNSVCSVNLDIFSKNHREMLCFPRELGWSILIWLRITVCGGLMKASMSGAMQSCKQETTVSKDALARVRRLLYFTDVSFFSVFSPHFLRHQKTNIPKTFPTRRGLAPNRTVAIPISSKCPLKQMGLKNPKSAPFFTTSHTQLAP